MTPKRALLELQAQLLERYDVESTDMRLRENGMEFSLVVTLLLGPNERTTWDFTVKLPATQHLFDRKVLDMVYGVGYSDTYETLGDQNLTAHADGAIAQFVNILLAEINRRYSSALLSGPYVVYDPTKGTDHGSGLPVHSVPI